MSTRARAPSRGGARRGTPTGPVVAVLAKRGRFWVGESLFERGARISLDVRGREAAGAGDLVLVGVGKRGPRILRRIGRPDVARDVLEGLMLDRGLWRSFPRMVEAEAAEMGALDGLDAPNDPGGPAGAFPRRDLIDLPTFTIDPITAKDYDDAISARREADGVVRVWVHIADVSAYVRPGGAVEREAARRGTSVYVPGAVEAMIPPSLSNQACSLVPGADRLAVTVEIEMHGPDVGSVSFYRSRIRSDARLTYGEVDEVFAGTHAAHEPWGEPLAAARAVARALRERRASRGSLEVTSSEPSFRFDRAGHVVGVEREEQTESHSLIEELMILANEQVAGYLADRRVPTIYRVHERPAPPSVEALVAKLASLEVPTPPVPKHVSPQEAGDLVGEISRLAAQHVRRTGRGQAALTSIVLRSLKQAVYSTRNVGHAGLASPRYCHFTSPIRRYPDLAVHRSLLAALGQDDAAPRGEDLEEAAADSSAAERSAMALERDADDVCLAFLLERTLADQGWEGTWEGEVVGLISAGAFVRFAEERFEGFLPVRRLRGDWWQLNEEGTILFGERSGRAMRLGDPVAVSVDRVETARGRVDLVPAPPA